jgi:hypothetical protein
MQCGVGVKLVVLNQPCTRTSYVTWVRYFLRVWKMGIALSKRTCVQWHWVCIVICLYHLSTPIYASPKWSVNSGGAGSCGGQALPDRSSFFLSDLPKVLTSFLICLIFLPGLVFLLPPLCLSCGVPQLTQWASESSMSGHPS